MNTKHTPGPWHYALQAGADTIHHISGPQGKPRICELVGNDTEHIAANARLIAAAPALLKHADWLLKQLQGSSGAGHNYWEQFSEYESALELVEKLKRGQS